MSQITLNPSRQCSASFSGAHPSNIHTKLASFSKVIKVIFPKQEESYFSRVSSRKVPDVKGCPLPIIKHADGVRNLMEVRLEYFRDVCKEYETRVKAAKEGDFTVLESGFWYVNEYFLLLEKYEKGEIPAPSDVVVKLKERKEMMIADGSFYHGLPPKGMEPIPSDTFPTGKVLRGYQLQEGVRPSEAVKNIRESLCFIDCGSLITLATVEMLFEEWGEVVANLIFSQPEYKFCLGAGKSLDIEEQFPINHKGILGDRALTKGHCYFFQNTPYYQVKDLSGEVVGFNVICDKADATEGQTYLGFGLPTEGTVETVVLRALLDGFNQEPINGKILTKELWGKIKSMSQYEPSLTHCKITMRDLVQKYGGGFVPITIRISPERVTALRAEVLKPLVGSGIDDFST